MVRLQSEGAENWFRKRRPRCGLNFASARSLTAVLEWVARGWGDPVKEATGEHEFVDDVAAGDGDKIFAFGLDSREVFACDGVNGAL